MTGIAKRCADMHAEAVTLPFGARVWIVVGWAALGFLIGIFVPVVMQDEAYHDFAPSALFGTEHFGIVASNIGFLIVGVWGLWQVGGKKYARSLFAAPGARWPYLIFFSGLVAVSFGSAYYHADPTTNTLLWDRLAMTIVFMALFAAVIADRINPRLGVTVMLPALMVLGAASMVYWRLTGDLRLYFVVQLLPMALILLICLFFPGHSTRLKSSLGWAFGSPSRRYSTGSIRQSSLGFRSAATPSSTRSPPSPATW